MYLHLIRKVLFSSWNFKAGSCFCVMWRNESGCTQEVFVLCRVQRERKFSNWSPPGSGYFTLYNGCFPLGVLYWTFFYSTPSVVFLIIWVLIHTISIVCSACKLYFKQSFEFYSLNACLGLFFLPILKCCFHYHLFKKSHVASWGFLEMNRNTGNMD